MTVEQTIMIVEDDGIIATDIERCLLRMGYKILAILSTGEDAVAKVIDQRPDLIIMDIELSGGIDGIEAAEQIHQIIDSPVIYLTAHSDQAYIERSKNTGIFAYLLKPFTERELYTTLEVVWHKRRLEEELCEANQKLRREIDERRRIEEEIRIKSEQLFHADKMVSLGVLTAGIAHEVNNPNNYMLLNIEIITQVWNELVPLLEDALKGKKDSIDIAGMDFDELMIEMPILLSALDDGSKRIRDIVKELKDYAKELPLNMSGTVDVNRVLKSALVLLDNQIKRSTLDFKLDCEDGIPEIKGDSRRIEQVLINLLQNACQALESRNQPISVRTSIVNEFDSKWIVIEIQDFGPGISKENLKRIKDPFFTTKRETGGTGLGIPISESIVHDHGGKIIFESTVAAGTIVRVLLPCP